MSSCVFPGSFDPVTIGHMDVIARASAVFDVVLVTIMTNISKPGCFSVDDRLRILQKACSRYPNVKVEQWNGLLADYMREQGQKILIRGVRGCTEFEHEYTSALINRQLNNQFETFFIPAGSEMTAISSSAVREIAEFGGDITGMVPKECLKDIRRILSNNKSISKKEEQSV